MSDETTLPPTKEPNTPRTWLKKAGAWMWAIIQTHPDKALWITALIAVFFVGRCSVGV